MALYYRCPCTAVLESPPDTHRGKACCPACGKVVVIPRDAISLTEQEIQEAKAMADEVAPPMMPSISVVPEDELAPQLASTPASLRAVSPPKAPTPPFAHKTVQPSFKAKPLPTTMKEDVVPTQLHGELIIQPPPEELESVFPPPEALPEPIPMAASTEDEAAQLFADAPVVGAIELPEAEPLPDIPEIPAPVGAAAALRAGKPPVAAAKKTSSMKAPAVPKAPIVAGKKPVTAAAPATAPAAKGKPSTRAEGKPQRRVSRFGPSCPSCGTVVQPDDVVCVNCGERLKKGGGVLKWFFILFFLIILAAAGVVAAVMFVPDQVPPVIVEKVKMVGGILKEFGVPVPPQLLPSDTGEQKPADDAAPVDKPAETPVETPAETPPIDIPVNMDIPAEVVIPEVALPVVEPAPVVVTE